MIEFAETKSSIIIFVYDVVQDISKISLISPSELYITDKLRLKLFKNVRQIQNVSKHTKYIEIVLIKDQKCKWYTINGPCREEKKDFMKNKRMEEINRENPVVRYKKEEEDVLDLLYNIYRNGDENTRRAMEKSLIESRGTVLSTNWEDVKQNKVLEQNETTKKNSNTPTNLDKFNK